MKKKTIFICTSLFLFTCIVFFQVKQEQEYQRFYTSKAKNNTITSFEKTDFDFYYSQLTQKEKVVFKKIVELYNYGEGVEIILDEPCSVYNISRVADAVRETQKNNFWNFIFPYCFDDSENPVDLTMESDNEKVQEKNIYKILVQFNTEIEEKEKYVNSMNKYGDLKKILEIYRKDSDFQSVNNMINKEKEIIINLLKESGNTSEKQIVEFFQNWIIKNMSYNEKIESEINVTHRIMFPNDYIQNTSSACVLQRKGICGGLSDLLVDLCNEVGIKAYSVKGTLTMNSGVSGPHQWVALVIDQETYYLDPTKDVILQQCSPLYTFEQFYGRATHKYVPLFYYDYEY